MVVLSLAVVGFWLIVLVIHFEIRKRELVLAVEHQVERYRLADERLAEYRASLERAETVDDPDGALESLTPSDSPEDFDRDLADALPESPSESAVLGASHDLPETLDDPTPAQISALVAPSPSAEPIVPAILEEAKQVAREQPEVATATIRRLIDQDPRPPRSPF